MNITRDGNNASNSSEKDEQYYLSTANQWIHVSVLLLYFICGIFGNISNIFLFTFSALSRTSSSLYLLAASITYLLVTMLVIPFRLFADGFNLDLTAQPLFTCQMVSYVYYICLTLPLFFDILATADRWAASCVQVSRRRFASIRIAKRLIGVPIILCCIFYSHIFVTFSVDPQPPPPNCSVDDQYAVPMLILQLVVYSLIPPFCLAFFSVKIILNATRLEARVLPVVQPAHAELPRNMIQRGRRRFNQMQVMLVCQALIGCILTLPFSIINLASLVIDNDDYFLTVYSFLRLVIFFNYVSSFYIFMICSKLYRSEFLKLVKRFVHRRL